MTGQDELAGALLPGAPGEQEFEAVFHSSPVGMAVMDEQGRFVRVNPALCRFLGRDRSWLLGRTAADVTLPEDLPVHDALTRRLETADRPDRVHKRYLRPDGLVVHGLVTAVGLSAGEGRSRRTLAQVEDVTQRMRAQVELVRLATHDALTALPGRRLLLERLEEALAAQQADGRTGCAGLVAVLFVDLDDFKLVNDALGHAAGDVTLVQVAERLSAAVGAAGTVGRLGGDEFLVLLPSTDEDAARALTATVEQALARPLLVDGDEVFVSASIGLALGAGQAGPSVESLLADADAAMYEAKRRGKRRYEVFDSAMRERARERARLAAVLRAAAVHGHVVVHYQPVVDAVSARPIAVEALARLPDADGTLLPPSQFLALAAATGVLPLLDAAVMREATAQVQRWRDELDLDLHLSVNVCAASVRPDLVPVLREALEHSRLPADRLTVELTEQALIDGSDAADDVLRAVREQGANLAIDDFGTGWASLTYLRRFPVNAIKIDQSFVRGLAGSSEDRVIVAALTDLARHLGLWSVTEGIETHEQHAALLALLEASPPRTSYAQGHLFGRPAPAADVPAMLQALEDAADRAGT